MVAAGRKPVSGTVGVRSCHEPSKQQTNIATPSSSLHNRRISPNSSPSVLPPPPSSVSSSASLWRTAYSSSSLTVKDPSMANTAKSKRSKNVDRRKKLLPDPHTAAALGIKPVVGKEDEKSLLAKADAEKNRSRTTIRNNDKKPKVNRKKNSNKEAAENETRGSCLFSSPRTSESLSVFDRLYMDAQRRAEKQAQLLVKATRSQTLQGAGKPYKYVHSPSSSSFLATPPPKQRTSLRLSSPANAPPSTTTPTTQTSTPSPVQASQRPPLQNRKRRTRVARNQNNNNSSSNKKKSNHHKTKNQSNVIRNQEDDKEVDRKNGRSDRRGHEIVAQSKQLLLRSQSTGSTDDSAPKTNDTNGQQQQQQQQLDSSFTSDQPKDDKYRAFYEETPPPQQLSIPPPNDSSGTTAAADELLLEAMEKTLRPDEPQQQSLEEQQQPQPPPQSDPYKDGISSVSSLDSGMSSKSPPTTNNNHKNPPSLFPTYSSSSCDDSHSDSPIPNAARDKKDFLSSSPPDRFETSNLLLATTSEERRHFLFSATPLGESWVPKNNRRGGGNYRSSCHPLNLSCSPAVSSSSTSSPPLDSAFERLYRNDYASSASRKKRSPPKRWSADTTLSRRLNYRPSLAQMKHPVSLRNSQNLTLTAFKIDSTTPLSSSPKSHSPLRPSSEPVSQTA